MEAVPFCPILPISGTSWVVIQMTSLITALFCCRSRSAEFQQTWNTHLRQRPLYGRLPFQVCGVSADLAHSPLPERSLRPLSVPGLRSFSRLGTHSPAGAFSAASPRSRSAEFRQTWNTYPCRSVLCGLSPFQVCGVSADLEHSPSPEASLWPVAVPGLRSFSRPGTLTPAGAFSAASFRSRSALFRQTWHTHPRQRLLHSLPPFQVCCRFST